MSPHPINGLISQSAGTRFPKLQRDVLSRFMCFSPDPARVGNMPSVIYVAIGLPGFIRCPVDANPPVTLVKWKKDGLPLRIDKVSRCSAAALVPLTLPCLKLETSASFLQMKLECDSILHFILSFSVHSSVSYLSERIQLTFKVIDRNHLH